MIRAETHHVGDLQRAMLAGPPPRTSIALGDPNSKSRDPLYFALGRIFEFLPKDIDIERGIGLGAEVLKALHER